MAGPSEPELDALMDRLVDGDRDAFAPLFAALHPRAVALARRRLSESDADDAAQRTMTALFARAIEFTKGRPVMPWFFAIARNEIGAIARRSRVSQSRERPVEDAHLLPAGINPEEEILEAERAWLLAEAIATLDSRSAEAVREQLVSERTGARPPALRKRVSRAYARLRAWFEVRT